MSQNSELNLSKFWYRLNLQAFLAGATFMIALLFAGLYKTKLKLPKIISHRSSPVYSQDSLLDIILANL